MVAQFFIILWIAIGACIAVDTVFQRYSAARDLIVRAKEVSRQCDRYLTRKPPEEMTRLELERSIHFMESYGTPHAMRLGRLQGHVYSPVDGLLITFLWPLFLFTRWRESMDTFTQRCCYELGTATTQAEAYLLWRSDP
jgi:hypothetical protein